MADKEWEPSVGEVVNYVDRPNEPYRVREISWSRGTFLIDPLDPSFSKPSHWAYRSDLEKHERGSTSWDMEAI